MSYRNLFRPIDIGGLQLKNRIAMAPMNNASQMDPITGQATEIMVDYFAERARGGVGLIVTGAFKVEYEVERYVIERENVKKWPYFSTQSIRMLAEMVARAHAYDTKVFFQLTAGPGRVAVPESIRSGVQPVSASANESFWLPDVTCRALETSEVEAIVAAYGRAAALARTINADGIEVHGHEGYLLDQFTTALWNRRTDKYGGDLRKRLTFPIEILNAIKQAAGDELAVTYRLAARHFIEAPLKGASHEAAPELGRDVDESIEMVKLLEKAGYDGFSLDLGCYESTYWAHPPNYFPHGFSLDTVAKVKAAIKTPVMVAGRLDAAEVADQAIAEGKTDIVALGRALLADPEWPNKVARGEIQRIRPCIGCHDGCIERPVTAGRLLSCTVNPSAGRERETPMRVRNRVKRILVAGGGAAGMEAARSAAERGHDVTLFEQSEVLGGNMLEYGVPNFKEDIRTLLAWYRQAIQDQTVTVEFGRRVDRMLVQSFDPDIVVIATGSEYHLPPTGESGQGIVSTCSDILAGRQEVHGDVVVVGGGSHGAETALWLAQQGANVTIVEREDDIVKTGMSQINRAQLVDMLADLDVAIRLNQNFRQVVDGGVETITRDMECEIVSGNAVVMAVGLKSNQALYDELSDSECQVVRIGDCKTPRRLYDAIFEGWWVGLHA